MNLPDSTVEHSTKWTKPPDGRPVVRRVRDRVYVTSCEGLTVEQAQWLHDVLPAAIEAAESNRIEREAQE